MDRVMELALHVAQQAEVYRISAQETSVGFESNRLKHLSSRQGNGTSLRLVKDGRIGFCTSNRSDNADDLVKMAKEVSQFGATASFNFPGPHFTNDVHVFDRAIEQVPLDHLVRLGDDAIAKVLAHTPGLLIEGRVSKGVSTVNIRNSKGADLTYTRSVMSMVLEGNLVRGTDILFVEEMDVSSQPILDSSHIAFSLIEQLEHSKNIASIPAASLPVIFTPKAIGSALLFAFAQAFNGRVVFQGASPVGHLAGKQVFDRSFNLFDDATINIRPSSRPFDDEGIPSQRTTLVEEGVVAHFLYDLQTAGLAGAKTTGNGSRITGGLPAPFISGLVIGEGSVPVSDLILDIREGLIVDMLMGAEQGNTLGGDFSGNVLLGYKIEKGKLVGRVKDTMVSGNIYEVMKDITLSQEAKWVGGMLYTPSIFFPRLSVSTKH